MKSYQENYRSTSWADTALAYGKPAGYVQAMLCGGGALYNIFFSLNTMTATVYNIECLMCIIGSAILLNYKLNKELRNADEEIKIKYNDFLKGYNLFSLAGTAIFIGVLFAPEYIVPAMCISTVQGIMNYNYNYVIDGLKWADKKHILSQNKEIDPTAQSNIQSIR